MTFRLAGVACLGSLATGSAFLIPFFKCRTSNRHFAQDLDAERRIIAFLEFDPFRYQAVVNGLPEFERSPGDVGLMAVRFGTEVVIDEAPRVIERVAKVKLRAQNAPFFEIDACILTDRTNELPGAVRRAVKALGNDRSAKRWARAEMQVLGRSSRGNGDWMDREFHSLHEWVEDKNWVHRWLILWTRHPDKEAVIQLGLHFVGSRRAPTDLKGRVLVRLTSGRDGLRSHDVLNAAETWLEAILRVRPTEASIGRVWLALATRSPSLQGRMFDLGMKYVQAAAWSETPPPQWPEVWTELWEASLLTQQEERGLLRHMALSTLRDKVENPRSLKLAVKALKNALPDVGSALGLRDWTCASRIHANAWIDAYLAVAPSALNPELVDAALHWLATEPGRLRRWADVFESLIGIERVEDQLLYIGNAWLKRASPTLTSWPRIAQFIFPQAADPEVEKLVKNWIETHPENPAAWALSLTITDLEERRHLQERI